MELKKANEVIGEFLNDDASGIYFGAPGGGMSFAIKRIITGTPFRNPNVLTLGTPGVGKNFFIKKALVDYIIDPEDEYRQLAIIDPEDEYRQLASQFPMHLKIISPVTQSTGSSATPGDPSCVTDSESGGE